MICHTARVVSGTHKFDRGLSRLLHTKLHWLDVPQRVVHKLGVMVFNCLQGQAPQYLVELREPVAGVASRQHLRSATQQLLVVPRHQLSSYGRWAFCVAGPSVWNSLPDSLRNPIIGGNSFRQSLKTFLFVTYWCIQRIRGFTMMCYINRLFTYLLTGLVAPPFTGYIQSNCSSTVNVTASQPGDVGSIPTVICITHWWHQEWNAAKTSPLLQKNPILDISPSKPLNEKPSQGLIWKSAQCYSVLLDEWYICTCDNRYYRYNDIVFYNWREKLRYLIVNETRDGSVVIPGDERLKMNKQSLVTVCRDHAWRRLDLKHALIIVHIKL